MNWPLFVSTFSLIFIAELPDKTAFATLVMATRGKPYAIFIGVALAFVVQTIVAVSFGSLMGMLPDRWVQLGAGILFLVFAAMSWWEGRKSDEEEDEAGASCATSFWLTVWQSFVVIFIAEWGDLTQLATASLSARYHEYPATIFISAILALWSVTAIAIAVGNKLKAFVRAETLRNISAILFVGIGLYIIGTWFRS